jgi:excinuclease ABC subunit C
VDELMIIRDWLKSKRGADVKLQVPRQGQQQELLQMAAENAAETLAHLRAQWIADESKQNEALAELQQALDLPDPPLRIECYDISTLQGTNTVGSMVVFVKGTPRKSDYRRFKIKQVQGQDDYASMQEMLRRRFSRLTGSSLENPIEIQDSISGAKPPGGEIQNPKSKIQNQESWALIPNLIIIDGGKGQLNAALEVLDEFELRDAIPIVGLAKQEEEIFLPGQPEPILLPRKSQGLFLVQRIRDEAHRFGVTYHRNLRDKSAVRSGLDEIEGIGPKRRQALLKHFGSLEAIRQATLEELAAVPGMNRRIAEELLAQL